MSPYSRRVIAGAVLAVGLAATSATCKPADPGAPTPARPTVAAIAPGGNISSVVDATAARGWPHRPDTNEKADIRGIVLATFIPPRTPARVRCSFGPTMGAPIRCALHTKRVDLLVMIGLPETRSATGRIFPRVPGVWEDGSYRITAAISATDQD